MSTRETTSQFWWVAYEGDEARPACSLGARDLPSAWRRIAREAAGSSFAMYDARGGLVRVGIAPPPALRAPRPSTAVALCSDGSWVVSGDDRGRVRAYEASTREVRWEQQLGLAQIDAILCARRAPWIVVGTRTGEIHVLDANTGVPWLRLSDGDARAVALSADDRCLAIAGSAVQLWSLSERVRLTALDVDVAEQASAARAERGDDEAFDAGVQGIAFVAGTDRLVGFRDRHGGELVLWDRRSGVRVAAHGGVAVNRLAVSPDGRTALVGVRDGGVQCVDLATLTSHGALRATLEAVHDLRVTPDGRSALAHDDEAGLLVMNLRTRETRTWLDEFEACAYVLRKRPRKAKDPSTDPTLVPADDTRVVALPRWRSGDLQSPLSGDGRRYAAVRRHQDEHAVALFDLERGVPYGALGHPHAVVSVSLDHQGRRAATRDARGGVFVWAIPDAPASLAPARRAAGSR